MSRISEVAEREAPRLLDYLLQRGVVPGERVQVLELDEVGRTLQLRVRSREVTLSLETAGKVWALPIRASN